MHEGIKIVDKSILFITCEKIKQYKNNKLKIIAPTRNDEFELPDVSYSVSAFQFYIKYFIKNSKN